MLPKVNLRAWPLLLLCGISLLTAGSLQAAESPNYQAQFGAGFNLQPYPLSDWGKRFTDTTAIGFTATLLQKQTDSLSYGLSHYRIESEAGRTLFFMDGFDVVADIFWWGDPAKITEKGPFWEKLYSHVGGKFGFYRAFSTPDFPTTGTENRRDRMFQAEGYATTLYITLGLGRLGMLEYSTRTHFSGGYDNHVLNKMYLHYVYPWDL